MRRALCTVALATAVCALGAGAAGRVGTLAGLLLSTALLGLSVALAAGLRRHRGRSPT